MTEEADSVIRAAGGVVWRANDSGVQVLLVHRDRYDDWSFPKGKLDPHETWEQAAVREVFEEAAVVPVLGPELAGVAYDDNEGRAKQVRYWAMAVAAELDFHPDDEITGRRWVAVADAPATLTYDRDIIVLESFLADRAARD